MNYEQAAIGIGLTWTGVVIIVLCILPFVLSDAARTWKGEHWGRVFGVICVVVGLGVLLWGVWMQVLAAV